MMDVPYERLNESHEFLPFDCGDEDLNEYLLVDSKHYQRQLLAVTYYLEAKGVTILFFSLLNDKITAIESSKGFWRKLKSYFPHSKHRKDYPAVKIGRFGVHKDFQHNGKWGSVTLDFIKRWMVTENKTGCRFLTVDAYLSAVPFYLKNGFLFMGEAERLHYVNKTKAAISMYYDLMYIS